MISTGFQNLDKALGGGFPEKTTILVCGAPGTGKTLVSLKFLAEGAKKGERCCYISLNEDKEGILRACRSIESLKAIEKHVDKNLIIEHIPLSEDVTMKKFVKILSQYPKIDRLVIDSVNKLLIFSENERFYRIAMADMIKNLRSISKCTLMLCETAEDRKFSENGESFECDGAVHLSFVDLEERPMRILSIHKMRYSSFSPKVPHELIIDSEDIRIGKTKII